MQEHDISIRAYDSTSVVSNWSQQDVVWMLGLYGTAIGAGTLFLPINAGLHGILPLIVMTLLAFPLTYYSHRGLCRFILSGAANGDNITDVARLHFGSFAGTLLTALYFFSVYPIMLLYSVAITNTTQSFIVNQLGMAPPPRALLSLLLIIALMMVVRFGQQTIVKFMSVLVYPFIAILIALSIYLIPHWHTAIFEAGSASVRGNGLMKTLWLLIPVMVFSFNHSPIISSFAVDQKHRFLTAEKADAACNRVLKASHVLMVGTVMLFVFSCVLSLSPQDLALAKQQNISILSYLANHFKTPILSYVAPLIAFIAITKSFFGHYLGASEGMFGLLTRCFPEERIHTLRKSLMLVVDVFMVLTCWWVATMNPSILGMIEKLAGPVIAIILFLLPMYAMQRVAWLKQYRNKVTDSFVICVGLVALSGILYGLLSG